MAPSKDSHEYVPTFSHKPFNHIDMDSDQDVKELDDSIVMETYSDVDFEFDSYSANENDQEDAIDINNILDEFEAYRSLKRPACPSSNNIANDNFFDAVLSSYDHPVRVVDSGYIPSIDETHQNKGFSSVDPVTKTAIIDYVENLCDDESSGTSSTSSSGFSVPPPRRMRTNLTNLYAPTVISTKRTVDSCLISTQLTRSGSTASLPEPTLRLLEDNCQTVASTDKRERKSLIKQTKSERRRLKTENRKAFRKELLRQKNVRSLTLKLKHLNY